MKRSPRRSGLCLAALGSILLVPFPAAGFMMYTTLNFGGDLSGYSITIKDPFDVGDIYCQYLDEFGEPTAGPSQFYSCEGWDYGDVVVSTTVIAPNSTVWHNGVSAGAFEAWESWYISQPGILGNWMAVSNHNVDIDGMFEWCLPVPPQVMCGFMSLPLGTQHLGQTADYALAHWGLPCNANGIETAVITVMSSWTPLAWERGGTIRCFSGFAIPTDLRDSFGTEFPGSYSITNDPCAVNLTKPYAAAGFHSHPFFTSNAQLNAGGRCHGATIPYSTTPNDRYIMNFQDNICFQGNDFIWPRPTSEGGTETPFYLLVPNSDEIKVLSVGYPNMEICASDTVWP